MSTLSVCISPGISKRSKCRVPALTLINSKLLLTFSGQSSSAVIACSGPAQGPRQEMRGFCASAASPAHSAGCFRPGADLRAACREAPGGSSSMAGQKLPRWTDLSCRTLQRLTEPSGSAPTPPHIPYVICTYP